MKKTLIALSVVLAAGVALAQQTRTGPGAGQTTKVGQLPDVVATVTYDTGAPADAIGNVGDSVGNRFNTHLGNPLLDGTAYGISFYAGDTSFSTVFFTFFPDPPVFSSYFQAFGIVGGAFNAFTFAPINPPGTTWLAGISRYVGLVNDTTQGQGFHGGQINWITNNTFDPYPNQNAMVRVTGDLVIPVELMHFDVE